MSGASPLVEQGQAALARAEWDEAVRLFEQAAKAGPSAEVYEFLAWAYWWTNDLDRTVKAREEAFKRYQAASETQLAARNAVWLSPDYVERGEVAVANGWRQRAHRLLDGLSTTPEHGWLAMIEADIALLMEDDTVRVQGPSDQPAHGVRAQRLRPAQRPGQDRRGAAILRCRRPAASTWCHPVDAVGRGQREGALSPLLCFRLGAD